MKYYITIASGSGRLSKEQFEKAPDWILDKLQIGKAFEFNTEAERDAKYDELIAIQAITDKAEQGQASLEASTLIATLAAYATEFKNGKVVQILTVLNQVGRAIFDKVENETTVNQDYEVLLHSMLIEMYANHRELYTVLFAEEKIEEVYETKVVVDFFKVIFTNKYITT